MRFEEWDFKKEDDQVIIAGFVAESYKFPSGVYLNSSAVKKIEIGKNKEHLVKNVINVIEKN